jgi:phosphatidylglycerophosphatase A
MLNKLGLNIITMFGIGRIKFASGTFASLATCVFFFILFKVKIISLENIIFFNVLIFLIAVFLIGIFLINNIKNNFNKKDAPEIVIDEFLGQSFVLLSLFFMPISLNALDKNMLFYFLAGFFLFRFFDIIKPFPINLIDKNLQNGFGIMFDDLVAGFFSSICIYIIIILWF